MDDEQKVSQRYRDLGPAEPPRHVDEAILAASRRAAEMHPAPLVPPTGRRQWYFPLAAAAVIVLAVAVTWHMQVEEPDPYGTIASAPAPQPAREAAEERKQAQEFLGKREAQPAAPAAAPSPAEKPFRQDAAREQADMAASRAEPRMREAPALGSMAVAEPPEKTIERIVELRKQGKHEEADKLLEAFRKRYPEYKVPEAALKK
jgi:hypothetical protein